METTKANGTLLKQCALRAKSSTGWYEEVAWIEGKFAVVGKKVKDEFDRVWEVKEVFGARYSKDLDKQIQAWRTFRDVLSDH